MPSCRAMVATGRPLRMERLHGVIDRDPGSVPGRPRGLLPPRAGVGLRRRPRYMGVTGTDP